ncbi:LOW QUALITY PROTEIN: hypothetical protein TorRG33x02_112120 [Trema orientale]|uniref:Uncharacterized protein n=1 Tax=Trema orientale TaxID=63057 RepID=A0A2P5F554_TREOI|nr:LOW QUALITY PROTEIN: hypothetical protein TorRG33x02_112120 [Trema orientale]
MREVTRRSRDVRGGDCETISTFPLLLAGGPGPGRVPLIYRRVFLHFLGTFLSLQVADLPSPIPTAPIFCLGAFSTATQPGCLWYY